MSIIGKTSPESTVPQGNLPYDMLFWNGSRWVAFPFASKYLSIDMSDTPTYPLMITNPSSSGFGIYINKSTGTSVFEVFDSGVYIGSDLNVDGPNTGIRQIAFTQPDGAVYLKVPASISTSQMITIPEDTGTVALTKNVALLKDYQSFTTQTADKSNTNYLTTNTAGFYRISYYMENTTADAGAGTVYFNADWTNGTQQSISGPLSLATNDNVFGSFEFYHSAAVGSYVRFHTSHAGAYLTSDYTIYTSIEKIA